jgi:hypothetical protein
MLAYAVDTSDETGWPSTGARLERGKGVALTDATGGASDAGGEIKLSCRDQCSLSSADECTWAAVLKVGRWRGDPEVPNQANVRGCRLQG